MVFFDGSGFAQSNSASSNGLNSPVRYDAKDSTVADIPNQIVRLYGEAEVQYETFILKADLIEIDLKKNEVIATYTLDSLGNKVGQPVFTAEGETSRCDYMKYNFETKKGFIKEVRMQQGEGYIQMAESKIQPNEEIHFKNGKFTTCDKEVPHFHFALTKSMVIPEKRIVTGPVYMEILRVPTPLTLPFAFFPNSETKKAGIIIPRFANTDQYGFGLQDLGYYIPLGEYWETYLYGSIFTTGRWSLQNISSYYEQYKYRGTFGVKFEQFRGKFYDTNISNKWTINWDHAQDPKAHPSIRFTSNVNFVSDNNPKSSLDVINNDFYQSQFNSSINLSKSWKTNKFRGTMGLKTSLQQSVQAKSYSIELPTYNLSVSRFDLGVFRKSKIGEKWYEKINITYSTNIKNFIQAPDSIFTPQDLYQVADYALNGMEQRAVAQANLRVLNGRFVFTPSANYREIWNFQYQDVKWNNDAKKLDTTDYNSFKAARDIAFAGSLSANFFGYYKFLGPRNTRFRHVATPTLNFTYRPDIGLFEEVQRDTLGNTRFISPFGQSLYRESAQGSSGRVSFGLNNTLEMKRRVKGDSINETMKAYKLIDAFSINGGYDFLKDSLNLDNFELAFRTTKFFNIFSFQTNASLSPYSWVDSTGIGIKEYAWNDGKGLGRFKTARGVLNANFTSKKGRDVQKNNAEATKDNANLNEKVTNPTFKDYDMPWALNVSYNINYRQESLKNQLSGAIIDSFSVVQTINFDGNLNLNEKWDIDFLMAFDIQKAQTSIFNIALKRDLHCWEASIYYQQNGSFTNPDPANIALYKVPWSISFKIAVKATMFQDIKYAQSINNPFKAK